MKLSDFVSRSKGQFFVALGVNQDFLEKDGYIQAQTKARQLKVVNDTAERGVALCQSFNEVLTNREEQKQFLLQIEITFSGLQQVNRGPDNFEGLTMLLVMPYNML